MKFFKYATAITAILIAFATSEISAKGKMVQRVYMYGFSASFNDSTVYFTDILPVDSAWMDTKTKFLLGRDSYALQLKEYMTQKLGLPYRTCIVVFNTKRSDLEKDYLKLKKLYSDKSKNHYDVQSIAETDFKFSSVDMSTEYEETMPTKQPKKDKPKRPERPKTPRM